MAPCNLNNAGKHQEIVHREEASFQNGSREVLQRNRAANVVGMWMIMIHDTADLIIHEGY